MHSDDQKPFLQPMHRDDLDMDQVSELESMFAEMFPGMKVVFAGDEAGEADPEVAAQMESLSRHFQERFVIGQCIDRDSVMPNFPAPGEKMKEDWQPADGWRWLTQVGTEDPIAWQCPQCDAADGDAE